MSQTKTTAKIVSREINGVKVNVFVIETIMEASAELSKSGKSYLIANFQGPCGVVLNGKPVTVSLTSGFENDKYEPTAEELLAAFRAKQAKKAAKKAAATA